MATDDLKHLSPKEIWLEEIEAAKVLVIKNISPIITEESLQNYLEVVTEKNVVSLYFYPAVTSISLAVFHEEITDVEKVQQKAQRRLIEKTALELLPLGDSIGLLLSHISGPVEKDALTFYFESKRCGSLGADVENCELKTDLNMCIILISASPEVFSKIVHKSDHQSGGVTFTVEPYYPTFHDPVLTCLQTRDIKFTVINSSNNPTVIASSKPAVLHETQTTVVSPVYTKPSDTEINSSESSHIKKDLENVLPLSQMSNESESGTIFLNNLDDESVPEHPQPSRSNESLQLTPSSSNTLASPGAREHQQKPLGRLQIFTDSPSSIMNSPVESKHISSQPGCFSMPGVQPSEDTQKTIIKAADSGTHNMLGLSQPHTKTCQIAAVSPLRQGHCDVEESHLHTGEESETLSLPKEEIQLLLIDCFPKKSEPCKVTVETEKELVRFLGQKNDIQTAKLKMYETLKLKTERVSSSELSETHKKLLGLQKTKNAVEEMLRSKGIHAVVLRKKDNYLHSYAFKDSEAKRGLELIEQSLAESTISLRDGQDKLLAGREWTDLIKDIEEKYIIKMLEKIKKVKIGGLDKDVVEQGKLRIISFLRQKTPLSVYKETLDYAVARCFKAELAESVRGKIMKTGGNLKLHDLLHPHGSDMFQLEVEVHGSDEAIEIFKTTLKSIWHEKLDFHRMCNSDEEDIQLVKAGLSGNGKDFLRGFEGRHKCYIDFTLPSGNKCDKVKRYSEPYRRRKEVDSPARRHVLKFDDSKSIMQQKDRKHPVPDKRWKSLGELAHDRADSDSIRREIQIGQITIVVKQGDIVKEQADALLNIVSPSGDLKKGSVISQSFVKAGGPELVQMYQGQFKHKVEGFVVTGAGNLSCKKVLHVMLRTRINDTDMEVRKVMRTCFKICNTHEVTHLALPPLGCGRLHGYDHDSVVKAMLDETYKLAVGAAGKLKKVTIVVYDRDICQKFLEKLSSAESQAGQSLSHYSPDSDSLEEDINEEFSLSADQRLDNYQEEDDDDYGSRSEDYENNDSDDGCMQLDHSESLPTMPHDQQLHGRKRAARNAAHVSTVTVKIFAKDKQSCLDCVKKLAKEIKENYLFESKPVTKKQELSQKEKENIKYILSKHKTSVKQKRAKGNAYILKGWKEEVYTVYTDILKVLSETSGTKGHQKVQHKSKSQGFCYDKAIEEPETPEYWSMGKNAIKELILNIVGLFKGKKSRLVKVDDATFKEIDKLVQDTWQRHLIGKGSDAIGLKHTGIQVIKIKRVENLDLYEPYFRKRQEYFKSLCKSKQQRFPQLDEIKGCKGGYIKTSRGVKCLSRDIYPQINEYYFFHGTKVDKIDAICENGLDSRLGSDKGMLGVGIYGAESSTKSDQYTDSKQGRTSGEKKMFLMRMVLGDMFLCTDSNPHKYRRPPCRTCLRDDCANAKHTQGYFDSVVGDMGKLFREFVVYDKNQCYPEYIITYNRI